MTTGILAFFAGFLAGHVSAVALFLWACREGYAEPEEGRFDDRISILRRHSNQH